MFQFIHVNTYGFKPGTNSNKTSLVGIINEMVRAPGHCEHVPEPHRFRTAWGMSPVAFIAEAAETFAREREPGKARFAADGSPVSKLRPDAAIAIVGVASWPVETADLIGEHDRDDHIAYKRWRAATIAWLADTFGVHLAGVVEHLDERFPHLHFYVRHADDPRLLKSELHPGHRAEAECKRDIAAELKRKGIADPKRIRELVQKQGYRIGGAHREGMRNFQSDYWLAVCQDVGLHRDGEQVGLPKARRLDRRAWVIGQWSAAERGEYRPAVRPISDRVAALIAADEDREGQASRTQASFAARRLTKKKSLA